MLMGRRFILLLVILFGVAFSGCNSPSGDYTLKSTEKDDTKSTVIDNETVLEPGGYIQFGYAKVPAGKYIVGHMEVEGDEKVDFYLIDTIGNYVRFTRGEKFYYNETVSEEGITTKDFNVAVKSNTPYFFIIYNTLSDKPKKVKIHVDIQ